MKISIPVVLFLSLYYSFSACGQDAGLEVTDAFGLTRATMVAIEGDLVAGKSQVIKATIDDQEFELELHPYSVRSEDFVLKVQHEQGTEVVVPGPPQTIRGAIRGIKGSRIVGSISEFGLNAKINLDEDDIRFIEPVRSKLADWDSPTDYVLYTPLDNKPVTGMCGIVDRPLESFEQLQWSKRQRRRFRMATEDKPPIVQEANGPAGTRIAEIGLDADVQFFNDYGSVNSTLNRMELVINVMNEQFEDEVGISHLVSGAIVRTSEPDPYSTTDASNLLGQFRNEWQSNQQSISRDVAHLFTGKNLNGSTIGIAYVGRICNNFSYGLVQSNFNGSLSCATDLSAHELGHNWDANHCNCSNRTMNASITCANRFSNTSINSIVSYRNTRGCLDTKGPENDQWANRIELELPSTVSASSQFATTEPGEPDLQETGATVWWSVTAPSNGMMRVDLEGSGFDTLVHVYTDGNGPGLANLQPVAFNDDETNTLQSDVNFAVASGRHYFIRVGGFSNGNNAASGNIQMSVSFNNHGSVDLFWSTAGLFSGAFNTSAAVGEFNTGTSGEIFLYYDPSMSELDTGAFVDIATSRPGIIEFTQAETFEYDILVNGFPFAVRWGDAFGEIADVTSDFIDGLGAFTVLAGTGMLLENTGPTFVDAGYDFGSQSFLFGKIEFDVIGAPGETVNLNMTRGIGMIVNDGVSLDPDFGSFRLVVTDEVLLGDVNCDGQVNLLDVQPFIDLIANGGFSNKADFDGDGKVTLLDVQPFVTAISGG